jgi:hypothetical protein
MKGHCTERVGRGGEQVQAHGSSQQLIDFVSSIPDNAHTEVAVGTVKREAIENPQHLSSSVGNMHDQEHA